MDDRFACIQNIIDGELQEDWYGNGEKFSQDAVEKALYNAYDMGARKHQPRYVDCIFLIKDLVPFQDKMDTYDRSKFLEIINKLEDALVDYEASSNNMVD